jgi:hypothetical protein
MNQNSPRILLGAVLALAIIAGTAVILDAGSDGEESARSQELQSLLGGLGFGPALDISLCDFSFDPRVGTSCPADHGPIAGATYFCSQHATSILYYPQLELRGEELQDEAVTNAKTR